MKAIKTIELILENCESIDVTNAVGDFHIDNIFIEVCRVASNCIAKLLNAKEVFIQLYKNGEFEYHGFYTDNDPIKRLKDYRDITAITITYKDNSTESYYVDYDEGEDEGCLGAENVNQKYHETEHSLFILISASKNFNDFDIDEVESDWYLPEEVTARIDLKQRGWKERFNTETTYQASLNSLTVDLNTFRVKLSKNNSHKTIKFDSKVFNELLHYIFYTFKIHYPIDQDDFKFIQLNAIEQKSNKYLFKLDNHDIQINYEKSDTIYKVDHGTVIIDNTFNISISDMLCFMWILSKINHPEE